MNAELVIAAVHTYSKEEKLKVEKLGFKYEDNTKNYNGYSVIKNPNKTFNTLQELLDFIEFVNKEYESNGIILDKVDNKWIITIYNTEIE